VREAAAIALGESGDERAIPLLIEALRDDAGGVIVQAAFGLGNFNDERVIAPLIQVL
jgi:HEAT repeat protein